MSNNYQILTAKQATNLCPDRFTMPPPKALQMLKPGNLVLILVDYTNQTTHRQQSEPIWCVVMRRQKHRDPAKDKLVVAVWPTPPPKKCMHHGLFPKTLLTVTLINVVDICFEPGAQTKELRII